MTRRHDCIHCQQSADCNPVVHSVIPGPSIPRRLTRGGHRFIQSLERRGQFTEFGGLTQTVCAFDADFGRAANN
jgi:hypothetical protein